MKILDLAFEQRVDETSDHAICAVIDLIKKVPGIQSKDILQVEDTIADIICNDQKRWYKEGFKDAIRFNRELGTRE